MAAHSSILAWRLPPTDQELQRVGQGWGTFAFYFKFKRGMCLVSYWGLKKFLVIVFLPPIYFYKLEANYNIVVVFAIHWHESAMDLHVFPIPIPVIMFQILVFLGKKIIFQKVFIYCHFNVVDWVEQLNVRARRDVGEHVGSASSEKAKLVAHSSTQPHGLFTYELKFCKTKITKYFKRHKPTVLH